MISVCSKGKEQVRRFIGKENVMAFRSTDGLLLAGSYSLVFVVVWLQRLELLLSFAYYPMLCLTTVLAISITTSLFSRQMSLDFTSVIFLLLWTPVSALLRGPEITSDLNTGSVRLSTTGSSVPTWLRQCVLHYLVQQYLEGSLNITCVTWIVVFHASKNTADVFMYLLRESSDTIFFSVLASGSVRILVQCIIIIVLASYSVSCSMSMTLVISTCYCLLSSASCRKVLVKYLANITSDYFDGLEQDYIEAFILILDIFIHLFFCIAGLFSSDIFVIALSCTSISHPLHDMTTRVWSRIQSEQTTLTPFPRAGLKDLLRHDDVCPVCLYSMRAARMTPCGHLFHGKCLRLCLKQKPVCPLCIQRIEVSVS